MASGIPTTRRTTRGTRAGGGPSVLDENAHLRAASTANGLTAPAGSSKPAGAVGKDAGAAGRAIATSRATAAAAAAKASKEPATTSSTVGKPSTAANRRRAAFGEVSNRNGGSAASSSTTAAGKKAADAKPAAPPKRKTRTSLAAEQAAADLEALRAAAGSTEGMAVDEPVQQPTGVGRPTAASRHRAAATTSTRPPAKSSASAIVAGSSRTTTSTAAPSATAGPSSRRTVNGASSTRGGGASAAAPAGQSASATVGPSLTVNHPIKREKTAPADDAIGIAPAAKRARTSSPEKPMSTVDDAYLQRYEEDGDEQAREEEWKELSRLHPKAVEEDVKVPAVDDEEDKDDMAIPGESAVRARAKDEGWEDLDEEDEFDPMMVSEYVREIFVYMQQLELTTAPNPEYMDIQPELQWKMRAILIDWLIEVHGKFRLLPETLFLAVNLVDRFLSARVISLVKLQLVGTTALFVAAKYEEVICPSVTNFLYMADNGFQDEEILGAERYLLQTLDFNLSYPNPIHFLRRISKADNYDIQTRTVAKYYMEIACVDHKMLHLKPSEIAAGAAWLARHVLDRGEWNANLVHYSGFSEDELLPAAQLMVNYILRPREKQAESFVKKYASKKYMKASTYSRDWAVGRYRDDGIMADAPKGGELRFDINTMRAERAILEESDEDL